MRYPLIIAALLFVSSIAQAQEPANIAFIVGSVMLLDTKVPGFTIALPLIISIALVSAALILVVANLAIRSQRRLVVTGREELLHGTGKVISVEGDVFSIRIKGEIWQAKSDESLSPGQAVKVTAMNGLMLQIESTDNQGES